MAGHALTIFAPFGIPVRVRLTWWPIFFLVLLTLARSLYPHWYPDLGRGDIWLMAAVATVLAFGSLLAHEFGHALAARRFGIPVHGVELFLLGGLSRVMGFTTRPRHEFLLAAMGPIVSLALACIFALVFFGLRNAAGIDAPLIDVLGHAAVFNAATAVFNLLPAYPLDGGRVLQGVLWHFTRRRTLSAGVAAAAGAMLGLLSLAAGVVRLVPQIEAPRGAGAVPSLLLGREHDLVGGIWLVLLGTFVLWAARHSYVRVRMVDRLSRLTVGEALAPAVRPIPATMSAEAAWQLAFESPEAPVAPVVGDELRVVGALGWEDGRRLPEEATVGDLAEPTPRETLARSTTTLARALGMMVAEGRNWVIVADADGRYEGTVTQASLQAAAERR